jgi:hypothetical protein
MVLEEMRSRIKLMIATAVGRRSDGAANGGHYGMA